MNDNDNNSVKAKVWRYVPALVLVLSVFLLAQTVNSIRNYKYIGSGIVPQNIISVSGEGEVFAIPDVATFSFSVTETTENVQDSQNSVTDKINSALSKIKSFGVDEKDIKTLDYSAFPKYEYPRVLCNGIDCSPTREVLVGYTVTQTISVKVRTVDDAGKIIGSLGEAGITNLSSLSFTVDDEEKLKEEARSLAIEEAKEKAKTLARDLGVKLVRIVGFSEQGNGQPIFFKTTAQLDALGRETAPVPNIPTGENKITSNITITYEIK